MATTPNNKDTIYVDIDDEITTIIDKLRSSDARIVALVLPKRATVFQSVVNMKLLKRAADTARKQPVLITSEAGLLPLAGSIGLYVANTLQSKPAIPNTDDQLSDEESEPETLALDDTFDAKASAAVPVGALAADEPAAKVTEDAETIDLDDEPDTKPAAAASSAAVASKSASIGKPNKKLAVPNFNRFRKGLVFGGLALVALIVFGYFALVVLPKATVTAFTDTSTIRTARAITLSSQEDSINIEDGIVPAKVEQVQKVSSQQAAATGQRNAGTRATGSITITNCSDSNGEVTIPAGTGISRDGLTFITQSSIEFGFTGRQGNGSCRSVNNVTSQSVDVTASANGAQYNLSAGNFSVANGSSYDGAKLRASSASAFSGGTDNNVKVIAQADVDGAKQKLGAVNADGAKAELKAKLEAEGLEAIEATFVAGTPAVTTSGSVGDQADNVTVTQTISYSMFGTKKEDIKEIVLANVNDKIDENRQSIQSDGLDEATYELSGDSSNQSATVNLTVQTVAGPKLNIDTIKQNIAGKKAGDVKTYLTATPGVEDVQVSFSPFWVNKIPGNAAKVTVNLEKSSGTDNAQ